MKRFLLSGLACLAAIASAAGTPAMAQNVVAYHNDAARSGDFTVPGLTLSAAAKVHADTKFHTVLTGDVFAQPLYWKQAGAKVGLLIVATESNAVYALNADTGAQVWKTQLATPMPNPPTHPFVRCGNINPEGVTGTPVIDPATGTLYLAAMTLQNGKLLQQAIFALSLADGKVLPHWPVNVDAAMAARHETFTSESEGQRSALQFFRGKLYVAYGGRVGDCADSHGVFYRGIVIEVTPSVTPAISGSWETRADRGGIWSQGGIAAYGSSLFVTTGNTLHATSWGDGEAVIRLRPGLARSNYALDYFTPANWQQLDQQDYDLGGTMAVPLTVPAATSSGIAARILALGKDGIAYLANTPNLGGIGHELATLKISNDRLITAPALYKTPTATLAAFTDRHGATAACQGNHLTTIKITAAAENPMSIAWCTAINGFGSPILTTSDGSANPLVWMAGAEGDNLLHAFNALTGQAVFSSDKAMTGLHHFGTIIAANRHIYAAGDGAVYAFTF